VLVGIDRVNEALQLRPNGKPRFYVCRSCQNLIREFYEYRYPDNRDGKPTKEEPLKVNDHAMDALRYLIMHIMGGMHITVAKNPMFNRRKPGRR